MERHMHLSPLDMLTLVGTDQDVIRCLIRRPQSTAAEISKVTKIPVSELNEILERLLHKSRVSRSSASGKPRFSVRYENGRRKPTDKPSLLDSLFG